MLQGNYFHAKIFSLPFKLRFSFISNIISLENQKRPKQYQKIDERIRMKLIEQVQVKGYPLRKVCNPDYIDVLRIGNQILNR